MRGLFLGLMLVAFTAVNAADESPFEEVAYQDEVTGFQFAKMLATYRFQDKVDYGDARLGYGLEYVEITGTKASIIVYDLGVQGLPDGTTDPRVQQELKKIETDIAGLVRKGSYKSSRRIDNLQPISREWLQVNHEILLPDGKVLKSFSFVRAQNGKFLKIRISGNSEGTYARLPSFILGVNRAVGLMMYRYR